MNTKESRRIDVHHHILPPEYILKLKEIGVTESYGLPFPEWSPEKSLAFVWIQYI